MLLLRHMRIYQFSERWTIRRLTIFSENRTSRWTSEPYACSSTIGRSRVALGVYCGTDKRKVK